VFFIFFENFFRVEQFKINESGQKPKKQGFGEIAVIFSRWFHLRTKCFDIRNQCKKLSRMTYVSLKNNVRQNCSPEGGTTGEITQKKKS
jgi:hypothetical protein